MIVAVFRRTPGPSSRGEYQAAAVGRSVDAPWLEF